MCVRCGRREEPPKSARCVQTPKSWLAQGLDKGSTVEDSAAVTSEMIVQWGLKALAAAETPAVPPPGV